MVNVQNDRVDAARPLEVRRHVNVVPLHEADAPLLRHQVVGVVDPRHPDVIVSVTTHQTDAVMADDRPTVGHVITVVARDEIVTEVDEVAAQVVH